MRNRWGSGERLAVLRIAPEFVFRLLQGDRCENADGYAYIPVDVEYLDARWDERNGVMEVAIRHPQFYRTADGAELFWLPLESVRAWLEAEDEVARRKAEMLTAAQSGTGAGGS